MKSLFAHILVVADLEGTSRCPNYGASAFMNRLWPRACLGMSRDVDAVGRALFNAGVGRVTVIDFHRTGYNLLPERMDPRMRVVQGYRRGPVPGFGDPGDADAVMFVGMHAASGSPGFLSHTLTSRIQRVTANGRPVSEVELFAAALGLPPVFFSGCPVACRQAADRISGIGIYPIEKIAGSRPLGAVSWRRGLAAAVVKSLEQPRTDRFNTTGPLSVVVTFRDGAPAARKMARRWGMKCRGADIYLEAEDMRALYKQMVRICFLTPFIEKTAPVSLPLSNLRGALGLMWARRRLRRETACRRFAG